MVLASITDFMVKV